MRHPCRSSSSSPSLLLGLAALLLAAACSTRADDAAVDGRISELGRYEGYSEPRFDDWVRSSEYVAMRDGVRLAVDVVRPAVDGVAVDEPLPVVWTHSRYHRTAGPAPDGSGAVRSRVDVDSSLQTLIRHGYVVAAVGVRGSGASFGRYQGLFSPAETRDAYEIIAWLADQAWSDGNVGMYGGSYLGITQYMAASQAPPALKAIFPIVALFDFYEVGFPAGLERDDFIQHWGKLTRDLDVNLLAPPVDDDPQGVERDRAVAEHADNWDVLTELPKARYRNWDTPSFAYARHSPDRVLDAINEAAVPAYHYGGWYDVFVTDTWLWWANYAGPQKLVMGPWSHSPTDPAIAEEEWRILGVEQLRWFDYWLKGIDNGIMEEPPIHYALMHGPGDWSWHAASDWPLAAATPTPYFFASGPSASIDSVNDGGLVLEAPSGEGSDDYRVDYTTTTGTSTRWDNAVGAGAMRYPDMSGNDSKSLTYTTPTLEEDLTVVGHPVVSLWVSSSTSDGNFHVLLEEVDAQGVSHYVTEGVVDGSLRATAESPWDNLGLPFQRAHREDEDPMPADTPVELRFDLYPTANVFDAGHRLRVVVMGADRDNYVEADLVPPPSLEIHRSAEQPSSLLLPILR